MKTFTAKETDIQRDWWVVDATDQTLGRLATQIASYIRGKHKPMFTPHIDCGDYVIVVNAEKIRVTGQKMDQKKYYRYSGYPGGLTETRLSDQLIKHPDRVITAAVNGMLPKNRLGRDMRKKLKVYAGPDHPHEAQKPQVLALTTRKEEEG